MRHVVLCSALVACGAAGFSPPAGAQNVRRLDPLAVVNTRRPATHSQTFTVAKPLGDCIQVAGKTFEDAHYEVDAPPVASPPPPSRRPRYVSTGRTARAVAQVVCVPIDPNKTSVTVSAFSSHPGTAEFECGRFAEPLRTGRRVVGLGGRPPEAHAPAVREAALTKNEPLQRTLGLARESFTRAGFKPDNAGDFVVTGGTPDFLVRVTCAPIGKEKTYVTVTALSSDPNVADLARDNVRQVMSQVRIDR
jgi:hypothetical protein